MRPGKSFLVTFAFLVGWLASCGAQDKEGPPPAPHPKRCQSLEQLAPALMDSLQGSQSAKLREVIDREQLFADPPDGSGSPIKTLLKVSLATLSSMASDPAEPGAPEGQVCNVTDPPPSSSSNRMCEARRILDLFIHQGEGISALHLLDPYLARILDYVVGQGSNGAHYEVAQAVALTCTEAYCRTEDGLDVTIGLLAFLEPTEAQPHRPQELLKLLSDLLSDPGTGDFMDRARAQMGEAQLVAFGNILLENLVALPFDTDNFVIRYHRDIEIKINDLLTSTLGMTRQDPKYAHMRSLLDQVIGSHEVGDTNTPHGSSRPLLMDLLDPGRTPPVLGPLQSQINCLIKTDPGSVFLKLIFDLSYKQNAIGLSDILAAAENLTELDARESLVTFLKRALEMIRQDQEGLAAARTLCSRMFDTAPRDDGPSNAELVMPVLANTFEGGVLGEVFCVTDTLLYGCASGKQPACGAGP